MKIANKIGLSFFAVTIICAVTALFFLYFIAKSELLRTVEASLESTAQSRAAHIETYLGMLKISVGQLSKSTVLENLLKITDKDNLQPCKEFETAMTRLRRTREANPSVYEFLLLDKLGRVIASSNEKNIGADKSMDACFLGGQKEIFIKDAYYLESINEPLVAVSAPLSDSQTGELLGVLVARVKLNDLWNITTEKTGLGETGEIYIVNKYGFMITPARFLKDTFLKQKVDTEGVRQAFLHKANGYVPHQELTIYPDYRGRQVLGTHEYIPRMQWVVLAEINVKEAFAPLARLRLLLLEILFITALAAWLLSRGISKLIAGPIKKLHEGTEIIGRGNFDYKVGTDANDEVGQLSRAFDKMTGNLKTITTSIENLNKDITEHKQAEEALQQSKSDLEKAYLQLQEAFELESKLTVQAQAASAAKSQFVANISHKIRTPLNGVIGICELLLETKMSNEQMEYAHIINSSAEALLNIINSTLDFSKIEAGKMELEHVDFNLRDIVEDIVSVLAVNAAKKQLELIDVIKPDVPLNLNGDPGRLRQVLFNLIGNAMESDREKRLAAGMNGYITKPISIKSVADAIANISSSVAAAPRDKTTQKSAPDIVFDSKTLSDRLSGDNALIREIINIFLEETPKSMRELEKNIEKQQQETAFRLAHTIKGSAANVGGMRLHNIAIKMESACASSNWQQAEALIKKIAEQFEHLNRVMREFLKQPK